MKLTRFFSVFVIVVALAIPSPATAQGKGPNPYSQIVRVEPFESVREYNPGNSLELNAAAASGCKGYTLGVNGYSIVGIKVWSYSWTIDWCYNGSTITSLSKYRTVWANYGWSFKGDIADNHSGGVGSTSYWHYAQGDFCFIETYTCVTHSYPWVNQTVYGNGNQTGSAGGN